MINPKSLGTKVPEKFFLSYLLARLLGGTFGYRAGLPTTAKQEEFFAVSRIANWVLIR